MGVRLTFASQCGLGLTRARVIGGPTRVRARVLGDEANNVKGHVAKVVDGPEAVAHGDGAAIFEPLHMEVGVRYRLQLGLKVAVLALH